MKNFESWWEANSWGVYENPYDNAKESWRAALEWALKDLEEQYERLCNTFECGWFGGTIEDELKDD